MSVGRRIDPGRNLRSHIGHVFAAEAARFHALDYVLLFLPDPHKKNIRLALKIDRNAKGS